MEPTKVEAIKAWPTPTNTTEVRGFTGFANFYRMFIKNYGDIARPLHDLTKKDVEFQWGTEQEQAFQRVKDLVAEEPVMLLPDPTKQYEMETDASNFAVGAQLSQRDGNGKLHPVAFFSKKLSGPALNYPVHDKELMAIIEAFREWRPYLSGTTYEVQVFTDHKNLRYFTTTKELNGRQTRWYEFLSQFNFAIHYKKGSENARADALSRRPDHFGNTTETSPPLVPDATGRVAEAPDAGCGRRRGVRSGLPGTTTKQGHVESCAATPTSKSDSSGSSTSPDSVGTWGSRRLLPRLKASKATISRDSGNESRRCSRHATHAEGASRTGTNPTDSSNHCQLRNDHGAR